MFLIDVIFLEITDTVFEWTEDAGSAGVRVEYSEPAACGEYTVGGPLRYNWELEEVAEYSIEWGAWVLAHELGHWAGMGEANTNTPSEPTVMNNYHRPPGHRCITALSDPTLRPATLEVLNGDAWQARWCLRAMRTGTNFPKPPGWLEGTPVSPGDGCTWHEVWHITIIMHCDDGCYIYDYDETFLGYYCF